MIILDGGSGYLRRPNGSSGGMNRVWAETGQTTVKRKDGTYLLPSDPGKTLTLEKEIPLTCLLELRLLVNHLMMVQVVVKRFLVEKAYKVTKSGKITTPKKEETSDDELGDYPSSTDGTYPVITHPHPCMLKRQVSVTQTQMRL